MRWSLIGHPGWLVALFVLVHSPLVGPVTWSWVAEELQERGHRVVVPSLKQAGLSGGWQACVGTVVQAVPVDEPAVLVGHSGAGPLLPVIADRMRPSPTRLVFVDAGVPPSTGDAPLVPDEFLDFLGTLARDGVLPKWSEWFGAGTMEALIPDRGRRAAVLAELSELPLSYFDGRVPMPSEWSRTQGAYVLLSDAYRADASRAASHGWPVIELPGAHLDIVTRPAEVADAVLDLTGQ
jgi:hypothetical protein